jgi:uncharacterized membrane protein
MQLSKSSKKNAINAKTIAVTAMFAALITVAAAFIKVPSPMGFVHAGDAVIYLAACVLPAPFNFIAAAVGGSTADLISGYAVYCVPSALIKALNVLPFFLFQIILKKNNSKILRLSAIPAVLISSAVTIGGYLLTDTFLMSFAAAAAEIPYNTAQTIIGAALFAALALALDAVKFKQRIKL